MEVKSMFDLLEVLTAEDVGVTVVRFTKQPNPENKRMTAKETPKQQKQLARVMPELLRGPFFAYLVALQARANANSARYPSIAGDEIGFEVGRKFVKVTKSSGPGQKSVVCFVDAATGTVWKAAGWNAPALNFPRGNVLDQATIAQAGWGHY